MHNINNSEKSMEVIEANIRSYIHILSDEIGKRNLDNYQNLIKTGNYLKKSLNEMGYKVNIYPYTATYSSKDFIVENIEVIIEGSTLVTKSLIIGAHYDTVEVSPGADDNASGI